MDYRITDVNFFEYDPNFFEYDLFDKHATSYF